MRWTVLAVFVLLLLPFSAFAVTEDICQGVPAPVRQQDGGAVTDAIIFLIDISTSRERAADVAALFARIVCTVVHPTTPGVYTAIADYDGAFLLPEGVHNRSALLEKLFQPVGDGTQKVQPAACSAIDKLASSSSLDAAVVKKVVAVLDDSRHLNCSRSNAPTPHNWLLRPVLVVNITDENGVDLLHFDDWDALHNAVTPKAVAGMDVSRTMDFDKQKGIESFAQSLIAITEATPEASPKELLQTSATSTSNTETTATDETTTATEEGTTTSGQEKKTSTSASELTETTTEIAVIAEDSSTTTTSTAAEETTRTTTQQTTSAAAVTAVHAQQEKKKESEEFMPYWALGVLVGGAVFLIVTFILCVVCCIRRRRRKAHAVLPPPPPTAVHPAPLPSPQPLLLHVQTSPAHPVHISVRTDVGEEATQPQTEPSDTGYRPAMSTVSIGVTPAPSQAILVAPVNSLDNTAEDSSQKSVSSTRSTSLQSSIDLSSRNSS